MDWSGLQGIFTLPETDPPVLYVDQPGSSHSLILPAESYPQQAGYELSSIQSPDRLVFVDEHGNLHESYQDIGFITQNISLEDDGEIPPHTLDHMYAKKPREPGSEQVAKPRRRSKKKSEQVIEPQYVIPDPIPQSPKINIIRQRLPSSVYKPISPSRPKILQGSSPIKGGNQSPSSSLPRKDIASRIGFSNSGRWIKKEDPTLTQQPTDATLGDEQTRINKGIAFANCAKLIKEQHLRSMKPFGSKINSAAILMDDLHKQEVGETIYEEEMLFDFGITEDEDEVNRCTLSSEEFNDVVFGECGFEGGLEPYPMSNPNSSIKGLGSTKLSNSTSSQRLYKKNSLNTSATLGSGMSDDEDCNQIMVQMGNRRKSRDWDGIGKVEDKIDDAVQSQTEEKDVAIRVLESFDDESDKSTDPVATIMSDSNDLSDTLLISSVDCKLSVLPSENPECVTISTRTAQASVFSSNKSINSVSNESQDCVRSKGGTLKGKQTKIPNDPISLKTTVLSKAIPEPTRRSIRAVRAPARLDDIDDGPPKKWSTQSMKKRKRY